MKLHILNDLHIEFEDFDPSATGADVIVLAGDIGVGMKGLHWIENRFPGRPVILASKDSQLPMSATASASISTPKCPATAAEQLARTRRDKHGCASGIPARHSCRQA